MYGAKTIERIDLVNGKPVVTAASEPLPKNFMESEYFMRAYPHEWVENVMKSFSTDPKRKKLIEESEVLKKVYDRIDAQWLIFSRPDKGLKDQLYKEFREKTRPMLKK